MQDFLGMYADFKPKFVKRFGELAPADPGRGERVRQGGPLTGRSPTRSTPSETRGNPGEGGTTMEGGKTMELLRTPRGDARLGRGAPAAAPGSALVPTMGYLHEGI